MCESHPGESPEDSWNSSHSTTSENPSEPDPKLRKAGCSDAAELESSPASAAGSEERRRGFTLVFWSPSPRHKHTPLELSGFHTVLLKPANSRPTALRSSSAYFHLKNLFSAGSVGSRGSAGAEECRHCCVPSSTPCTMSALHPS
ncbi:hypothetical protein DNTS_010116 [Danionella cerebrum]|uniref:Uncharacterized protein n=1 Tax=Danionella cerebrum TaxID=2873325 RepID=A0A553MM57_9TELE|nr:hypothetical protein DNTS_010116 [Danionella translucida]